MRALSRSERLLCRAPTDKRAPRVNPATRVAGAAAKISVMRSVLSVAGGMLVAFVLVPVLSWVFQLQPSTSAVRTFAPILLFVCGLSFYFGGMAAAFKAPDRHRLHGTLVAPAAFVISPVVNLLVGKTPFPGIDSVGAVLLAAAFLAASVAAAYVGARRGQALQVHNDRVMRRIRSRKSRA